MKAIGGNTCCLGCRCGFSLQASMPHGQSLPVSDSGTKRASGVQRQVLEAVLCLTLHGTVEAETPKLLAAPG